MVLVSKYSIILRKSDDAPALDRQGTCYNNRVPPLRGYPIPLILLLTPYVVYTSIEL